MEETRKFVRDKNVIVKPKAAIYTVGSYLQSAGSAGLVTRTLVIAKVVKVSVCKS